MGLPGRLKSGIEALSGIAMDQVRVRYNSPHPARLEAAAFARGREIHLAPGEEAHLPHEAWHIVQQAQGRVRPTLRMDGGTPVNDDQGLEAEADRMGARAAAGPAFAAPAFAAPAPPLPAPSASRSSPPAQLARSWWKKKNALLKAGMIGGTALAGLGALFAAPVVAGIGAVTAIGSGIAYGLRQRKPTTPVTDDGWYGERQRTAYGYSNSTGKKSLQGPHFVPHIAKTVMSERSVERNPNFDPSRIYEGSGVLPTSGQARRLLKHHEQLSGDQIPMERKKELDQAYKEQLKLRKTAPTSEERILATTRAMELNPMTTYAHGRKATHAEISGKGERRTTVSGDVDLMENMKKGTSAPIFRKIDYGPGHFKQKHLDKFLRDTGSISRGEEDLSDLDTDSEDEYS